MSTILGGGKEEAQKAARLQQAQLAKQTQVEQARIAKEEDVIGRRRALGKASGRRSSLIATGQTGVTGNLGGS